MDDNMFDIQWPAGISNRQKIKIANRIRDSFKARGTLPSTTPANEDQSRMFRQQLSWANIPGASFNDIALYARTTRTGAPTAIYANSAVVKAAIPQICGESAGAFMLNTISENSCISSGVLKGAILRHDDYDDDSDLEEERPPFFAARTTQGPMELDGIALTGGVSEGDAASATLSTASTLSDLTVSASRSCKLSRQ